MMQSLQLSHCRCSLAAAVRPRRSALAPRRPAQRRLLASAGASEGLTGEGGEDAGAGAGASAHPPVQLPPQEALAALHKAMESGVLGEASPGLEEHEEHEAAAPPHSYLPDASDELAASADLTLTIGAHQLPVHSVVLAAGARALRATLSGSDSQAAKQAVVQQAFAGRSHKDVRNFLNVLYNDKLPMLPHGEGLSPAQLEGVLVLACELDAPNVLEVCEARMCALCQEASATPDGDQKPAPFDCVRWLQLADRYGLHRLLPLAAALALRHMAGQPDFDNLKAALVMLSSGTLSTRTWQMLFEALAVGAGEHFRGTGHLADHIPRNFSRWSKPGDFC